MEMDKAQIESSLAVYMVGKADRQTQEMIEGWISQQRNLPAFYDMLLRFESEQPVFESNAERAMVLCRTRLALLDRSN
ncbi:hypothetical protein [Dyadobacter pollutisoli]|uniref:Uncharacterized protein n=1 Tax=Dyadobacter pollutisoli TaxID=2910158 RepID=A0A9E8NEH0_9BACT|nr:hypothetical protein [Dyadobacter pollutisoli]WAC13491.1 hypothetical protein ON006_05935 [Dyadobacter pollutisoli]